MYVFSLIFFAVEAGDIAMAENALLQGGSVNVSKPMGETPLSLAVESENIEMATWLLSHGADVNAILRDDETAFTLAKTESMAKLLLQHHVTINNVNRSGENALYKATMRGNLALVRFLISVGIVFDKKNSSGLMPIDIAKYDGHVGIARLLLDAGSALPEDLGWLSLLLGQKMVIDGETIGNAELLQVFTSDWMNNDMCELLIAQGADVNATDADGNTALHLTNCVDVLLKAGANIETKNSGGETPLLTACLAGAYQAADALIKHDADITVLQKLNSDVTCALLNATARYGRPYLLEKLVKLGLDVNRKHEGSYALIRAISHNELEVAKWLIAHGANVNLPNDDGYTALSKSDSFAMAQLMVDHGAKIDEMDSEGNTLLHLWCGAQQPKLKMVEFLIKQGLDVNAKNNAGETPLRCSEDSALMANYLLEHGANTYGVLDDLDWDSDLIKVVLGYQARENLAGEITLS